MLALHYAGRTGTKAAKATNPVNFVSRNMKLEASTENLDSVLAFIRQTLVQKNILRKDMNLLMIASEEIYVNIANYAYAPGKGFAEIIVSFKNKNVTITFRDAGKAFNPLEKSDPDVNAEIEDRNIGGLGIYMAKEIMDEIIYSYQGGGNTLTIRKKCEIPDS